MSTNDYVKYLTQQVVKYMDTPKEVRQHQKQKRKEEKAPLMSKWFGILPFGFILFFKNRKNKL